MYHAPHVYAFADEASPMIASQIAAMQRNHLDGLEIRNVDGQNVSDISLEKAQEVKKQLDDAGLVCWSIGSPIGKIQIGDDFAAHLDVLLHTLDVADVLGAGNVRMFSFYLPEHDDPALYRNEVIDKLGKILEVAKGRAALCHENEKGIFGDSPDRCLDLLTTLPELDGVFETANYIQGCYDPCEAFPRMDKRTKYLHIKDALFADGSVTPAGHGDGHLADIVRAFTEREDPHMTIEPHLMTFAGLARLEQEGQKTQMGKFVYESNDAAFDAACSALRELLSLAQG